MAVLIASLLVKFGPQLTEEIATLLHRDTPPTLDEWKAIFNKVRSLDDYVAEARANVLPIGSAPVPFK